MWKLPRSSDGDQIMIQGYYTDRNPFATAGIARGFHNGLVRALVENRNRILYLNQAHREEFTKGDEQRSSKIYSVNNN
ncbi:unnamed protein product [Nesidiocoris tenuis]|uniref:Uncharacterized protein n=1 Tax=Nesidiocoris tenuis TaxID=355587 RepID=A0A6H5H2P8_9HEMI|nr:unnamed protein product [Nesidiocoris tenuis]